jgi:hypothetical protein
MTTFASLPASPLLLPTATTHGARHHSNCHFFKRHFLFCFVHAFSREPFEKDKMERIKYVGAAAVAADTSDRRIIGAANALTGPTVCHDVVQTVHFAELAIVPALAQGPNTMSPCTRTFNLVPQVADISRDQSSRSKDRFEVASAQRPWEEPPRSGSSASDRPASKFSSIPEVSRSSNKAKNIGKKYPVSALQCPTLFSFYFLNSGLGKNLGMNSIVFMFALALRLSGH